MYAGQTLVKRWSNMGEGVCTRPPPRVRELRPSPPSAAAPARPGHGPPCPPAGARPGPAAEDASAAPGDGESEYMGVRWGAAARGEGALEFDLQMRVSSQWARGWGDSMSVVQRGGGG